MNWIYLASWSEYMYIFFQKLSNQVKISSAFSVGLINNSVCFLLRLWAFHCNLLNATFRPQNSIAFPLTDDLIGNFVNLSIIGDLWDESSLVLVDACQQLADAVPLYCVTRYDLSYLNYPPKTSVSPWLPIPFIFSILPTLLLKLFASYSLFTRRVHSPHSQTQRVSTSHIHNSSWLY